MVVGIDRFREYFKDYQGSYVLIGGVAASITMELLDEKFRTTKDLDVVLVVEALHAKSVTSVLTGSFRSRPTPGLTRRRNSRRAWKWTVAISISISKM